MSETSFRELGVIEELATVLDQLNLTKPTEIQAQSIPRILAGEDILAQAETGSGKTGAFLIPLIQKISQNLNESKNPVALIFSPTRELSVQTSDVCYQLGNSLGVTSLSIIGGESADRQKEALKKFPHIIIGTPGRMIDLYKQKLIDFSDVKFAVLDEADRLLDMGFKDDLQFLLSKMPRNRQLLLFTATSNMDILNIAYRFHAKPVEIKLNLDQVLVDHIVHTVALLGNEEKMPLLVGLLRQSPTSHTFIFCNTKVQTTIVAVWLNQLGFKAHPISGDLPQNKRQRLLQDFRGKEVNILVCTDVAARGLDIKGVDLVINFDLPHEAANYVHRIGRTGRAGEAGRAISFCGHEDSFHLEGINEYLGKKIPKEIFSEDLLAQDIGRRPYVDTKTGEESKPFNQTQDKGNQNMNDYRKPGRTGTQNNRRNDGPRTENSPRRQERQPERPRPQQSRPAPQHAPRPAAAPKKFEVNTRSVKVEATKLEKALKLAAPKFPQAQASWLSGKVVAEGKRTFFGLGPKMKTFEVSVLPQFDVIATDYLLKLFSHTPFDVGINVKKIGNTLNVHLNGPDEAFLAEEIEIFDSLEYLLKRYLGNLVSLPHDLNVVFHCAGVDTDPKLRLEKEAKKMAEKAVETNGSVVMGPLSASDRYVVHQLLGQDNRVMTSSFGDGNFKKIRIICRYQKGKKVEEAKTEDLATSDHE